MKSPLFLRAFGGTVSYEHRECDKLSYNQRVSSRAEKKFSPMASLCTFGVPLIIYRIPREDCIFISPE
jgi:hypothetical protein